MALKVNNAWVTDHNKYRTYVKNDNFLLKTYVPFVNNIILSNTSLYLMHFNDIFISIIWVQNSNFSICMGIYLDSILNSNFYWKYLKHILKTNNNKSDHEIPRLDDYTIMSFCLIIRQCCKVRVRLVMFVLHASKQELYSYFPHSEQYLKIFIPRNLNHTKKKQEKMYLPTYL